MSLSKEMVTAKAKEIGFDLVGFSEAAILMENTAILKNWLNSGYNAGMEYMERNIEKRENVKNIFPNAQSVISLGLNYYTSNIHTNKKSFGKISRYGWGTDYHFIIWEMLDKLIVELQKIDSTFEAKSYVDTGPVMDKTWAVRSGLGWIGKHSNVINKNYGSWFFIAEIINNFSFPADIPSYDYCGSCTKCIDACPTNAIVNEREVDANKCISYLTIENKGEIPTEFEGKFENWLFGCDICQDVCPWNIKFAEETNITEFKPKLGTELNLTEITEMTNSQFKSKFRNSPVKRSKLKGLKRNAEFLLKQ